MTSDRPARGRWWAIAHLRCPRCFEGRVFRSLWAIHDDCPVCGLHFMRETGYFMGAMYFSYGMGIPIIALLTLFAYLLWPHWHLYQHVLVAWVVFLPLAPFVYRYSRIFWLHFDRYFDPDDAEPSS
jgi:uncharacterized protein (DUF983 family)